MSRPPAEFRVVYDLREPGAWQRSNRDRNFWGKLYTDITRLDDDHLLLTFRPAPDARWRPWERVRRRWILGDAA